MDPSLFNRPILNYSFYITIGIVFRLLSIWSCRTLLYNRIIVWFLNILLICTFPLLKISEILLQCFVLSSFSPDSMEFRIGNKNSIIFLFHELLWWVNWTFLCLLFLFWGFLLELRLVLIYFDLSVSLLYLIFNLKSFHFLLFLIHFFISSFLIAEKFLLFSSFYSLELKYVFFITHISWNTFISKFCTWPVE